MHSVVCVMIGLAVAGALSYADDLAAWWRRHRSPGRTRPRAPRPIVWPGHRWGFTFAELRRLGVAEISGPFEIPGYGIFELETIDLTNKTMVLVALCGAGEEARQKGGMPI